MFVNMVQRKGKEKTEDKKGRKKKKALAFYIKKKKERERKRNNFVVGCMLMTLSRTTGQPIPGIVAIYGVEISQSLWVSWNSIEELFEYDGMVARELSNLTEIENHLSSGHLIGSCRLVIFKFLNCIWRYG